MDGNKSNDGQLNDHTRNRHGHYNNPIACTTSLADRCFYRRIADQTRKLVITFDEDHCHTTLHPDCKRCDIAQRRQGFSNLRQCAIADGNVATKPQGYP